MAITVNYLKSDAMKTFKLTAHCRFLEEAFKSRYYGTKQITKITEGIFNVMLYKIRRRENS